MYYRGMIRAGQARAARMRYREMAPVLNEQSRRCSAASEAQVLGQTSPQGPNETRID